MDEAELYEGPLVTYTAPPTKKIHAALREGIMREATAALAAARAAQSSMTRRNAKTKAWAMASRMAEDVWGSRPAGTSRPASLMTLD